MKIVSETRLQRFEEDGYTVVEEVLDPARDFDAIWAEYARVLDDIVESLYSEGVIHSTYSGFGFAERLIRIYVDSGRNFHQHFDISLPQTGLRRDTPIHVGPAV